MKSELPALTGRQKEIVQLAVRGYSAKEIARSLMVSQHTVRTHLKNIFRKWGVHSKAELAGLWHSLPATSDTPVASTALTDAVIPRVAWAVLLVAAVAAMMIVLALQATSRSDGQALAPGGVKVDYARTVMLDGDVYPDHVLHESTER
jgi:DNA-binding CsgD family transcriptional regulator